MNGVIRSQGQQCWFYNEHLDCCYYYDEINDQFVYENGTRDYRHPEISRESLLVARQHQSQMSPQTPRTVPQHAFPSEDHFASPSSHQAYTIGPSSHLANVSSTQQYQTWHTPRRSQEGAGSVGGGFAPSANILSSNLGQLRLEDQGHQFHQQIRDVGMQQGFQEITYPNQQPEALGASIKDKLQILRPAFRRPAKPRDFFKVGKVFLTLWSQPAGDPDIKSTSSDVTSESGISVGVLGQRVFSKIQRFIVVKEGFFNCSALAINTYNGQGVSKRGVMKCEHAIAYIGRKAPREDLREKPARGEQPMLATSIRIDPDSREEILDSMSRIDFGRLYTIEHNIKVRSLGKVNEQSEAPLLLQFQAIFGSKIGMKSAKPRNRTSEPQPPVSSPSGTVSPAYDLLIAGGYSRQQALAALKEDHQPGFAGHGTEVHTSEVNRISSAASHEKWNESDEDKVEADMGKQV